MVVGGEKQVLSRYIWAAAYKYSFIFVYFYILGSCIYIFLYICLFLCFGQLHTYCHQQSIFGRLLQIYRHHQQSNWWSLFPVIHQDTLHHYIYMNIFIIVTGPAGKPRLDHREDKFCASWRDFIILLS